jgi:hypothetical protein
LPAPARAATSAAATSSTAVAASSTSRPSSISARSSAVPKKANGTAFAVPTSRTARPHTVSTAPASFTPSSLPAGLLERKSAAFRLPSSNPSTSRRQLFAHSLSVFQLKWYTPSSRFSDVHSPSPVIGSPAPSGARVVQSIGCDCGKPSSKIPTPSALASVNLTGSAEPASRSFSAGWFSIGGRKPPNSYRGTTTSWSPAAKPSPSSSSATTSVTRYVPGSAYAWVTVGPVANVPSPNSQR